MGVGLYVHIPFCASKCHYCNFTSFPLKDQQQLNYYLKNLNREIELVLSGSVETVFFGGGTPSICSEEQLEELVNTIARHGRIEKNAEISIEINPGTIDRKKLKIYKQLGINRLSIGVQSLDDKNLKQLGRGHKRSDTIRLIEDIKNMDFENFSCDLIFGLPNQTLEFFQNELEQVIALKPKHLSLYGLSIEKKTQLYHHVKAGFISRPDEDVVADMYEMSQMKLEKAGLYQYELSNFSEKGFICKHNLKYWSYSDYMGVGLGAHSFMDKCRYWNTGNLFEYNQALKQSRKPTENFEKLDNAKRIAEFIIVGLRQTKGIMFETMNAAFGDQWNGLFEKVIKNKALSRLLMYDHEHMWLSNQGMLLSNIVFREFL